MKINHPKFCLFSLLSFSYCIMYSARGSSVHFSKYSNQMSTKTDETPYVSTSVVAAQLSHISYLTIHSECAISVMIIRMARNILFFVKTLEKLVQQQSKFGCCCSSTNLRDSTLQDVVKL